MTCHSCETRCGPSERKQSAADDRGRPNMTPSDQMRSNEIVGKRLLTPKEAAAYLGLQLDTVYKKSRLRELPSVKVGRALRFDVKALQRFIEQHTVETLD